MQIRMLKEEDVDKYSSDIISIHSQNGLIFDAQSPLRNNIVGYIRSFVIASDAIMFGVIDEGQDRLYGLVTCDNIRVADGSSFCDVHICLDRGLWGKTGVAILSELNDATGFDVVAAHVPSIASNAIRLLKALGFRKTGYIPRSLPYQKLGNTIMCDTYVYSLWKDKEK